MSTWVLLSHRQGKIRMDREQASLGSNDMSTGPGCWMHPIAFNDDINWGPFGKGRSGEGPGTGVENRIRIEVDHDSSIVLFQTLISPDLCVHGSGDTLWQ